MRHRQVDGVAGERAAPVEDADVVEQRLVAGLDGHDVVAAADCRQWRWCRRPAAEKRRTASSRASGGRVPTARGGRRTSMAARPSPTTPAAVPARPARAAPPAHRAQAAGRTPASVARAAELEAGAGPSLATGVQAVRTGRGMSRTRDVPNPPRVSHRLPTAAFEARGAPVERPWKTLLGSSRRTASRSAGKRCRA